MSQLDRRPLAPGAWGPLPVAEGPAAFDRRPRRFPGGSSVAAGAAAASLAPVPAAASSLARSTVVFIATSGASAGTSAGGGRKPAPARGSAVAGAVAPGRAPVEPIEPIGTTSCGPLASANRSVAKRSGTPGSRSGTTTGSGSTITTGAAGRGERSTGGAGSITSVCGSTVGPRPARSVPTGPWPTGDRKTGGSLAEPPGTAVSGAGEGGVGEGGVAEAGAGAGGGVGRAVGRGGGGGGADVVGGGGGGGVLDTARRSVSARERTGVDTPGLAARSSRSVVDGASAAQLRPWSGRRVRGRTRAPKEVMVEVHSRPARSQP